MVLSIAFQQLRLTHGLVTLVDVVVNFRMGLGVKIQFHTMVGPIDDGKGRTQVQSASSVEGNDFRDEHERIAHSFTLLHDRHRGGTLRPQHTLEMVKGDSEIVHAHSAQPLAAAHLESNLSRAIRGVARDDCRRKHLLLVALIFVAAIALERQLTYCAIKYVGLIRREMQYSAFQIRQITDDV